MRYDANDQSGALSDHQKFGESATFDSGAADAGSTTERVVADVKSSIGDAESTIQEKASHLKGTLADKLESGAESLRSRSTNTGGLDNAVSATKQKVAGAGERIATGMEQTAGWLRGSDMASMQQGLEKQVKENPARTLLIAAGVGYLLGRAFKGRDS